MRNRLRAAGTGIAAGGAWALAWLVPGVRAEILASFAALTLTLAALGLLVLPSRFSCFMAGLRGAEILSGRAEDSAGPGGDGPILTMLRDATRGRLERYADAEHEDPEAHAAGLA